MLRFLLTFLSLAVLVAGEVAPAATPPAAQAALERLAKAEAKIDFDAAKARSTERLKAIKELEKVQVSTTKSGDLDVAVAIKARIEELRKLDEIAADELMGDAKPAAKDPAKLAVGSWSATKTNGVNAQIEMKDDKSAKAVWDRWLSLEPGWSRRTAFSSAGAATRRNGRISGSTDQTSYRAIRMMPAKTASSWCG